MSERSDLLERFRRGPELVAVATTGAGNPELDYVPGPDKWSVRQIACHLADIELATAIRVRRILAEDEPPLEGYPGDLWAERLDYRRRKISLAIETFRRTRAETFEILNGLDDGAFARKAVHAEWGPITVLDLLRIVSNHDAEHTRQIMEVRSAYKEAKARGAA